MPTVGSMMIFAAGMMIGSVLSCVLLALLQANKLPPVMPWREMILPQFEEAYVLEEIKRLRLALGLKLLEEKEEANGRPNAR